MKVIYDLEAYGFAPHGGIARIFDETLARLARKPDFSARLYAPGPLQRLPVLRPRVRRCLWRAWPRSLARRGLGARMHAQLERVYWRARRADLFHPTFYTSVPRVGAIPWVVTIYDLIHERLEQADDMPDHAAFKAFKAAAIQRAARLICISESTRRELLKYHTVDPDIVRVVYPGFSPVFQPIPASEAESKAERLLRLVKRPFLLYVGSRQRYKNFHRLLLAYKQWARCAESDLVVVGAPRTLADCMAEDLAGPGGMVHYVGPVSDEELRALYALAGCFVYPSLCEGFGIPVLEAMACGCPLCLSDIPPFREVAGECAVFFDPYSQAAMHAAFDRSLEQGRADELSDAAQAQLAKFSWDACAEGTWAVYRELAGER